MHPHPAVAAGSTSESAGAALQSPEVCRCSAEARPAVACPAEECLAEERPVVERPVAGPAAALLGQAGCVPQLATCRFDSG